jgi:uncharacterized protein YgiM (DUF1202 family)
MKKKTYLRIRALILVLLLILTTLVISPEQVLADTEVVADEETTQVATDEETTPTAAGEETTQVAADEETTPIAADEETPQVTAEEESTQVTADEEVTATINDTEDQNDSDRLRNEVETDTVSETTILPTPESTSQPTEINAEGSGDTGTDTLPTVESTEAEQVAEEAVSDKQDEQDADTAMTDHAECDIGARVVYTPEEDFNFDSATGTIRFYIGSDKVVNIPPYIKGVKVEHIGEGAFRYLHITSVTIPNSVKTIGDHAFIMNKLTSVTIPDSVIEIKDVAFQDNKLTSVTIPNSVTEIGERAFYNNQLKSVTISGNVTYIKDSSFRKNQLTSVTIPNSVKKIGKMAFAENQLASVTIPNSVMIITYAAFYQNKLTNITIPESVRSIGIGAFSYNEASWASIPDSINYILDYDGESLVYQPTIEEVGKHCFNPEVSLIGKRYIKANYNIRKSPDGEVITKLWRPLYVTGTSTSTGSWLEFNYNGEQAYVAMTAITKNPPPMTGYAKQTLNLRDVPGGLIIGTIPKGHKVSGIFVRNTVETTYNGKTGYVSASLLQKDPVQVTRYVKAGSNIRSAPGGTIIETLKMPIFVTGTITGSYLRFTYKSKIAYVAMSLTTTQNPPITGYAKSAVNVRNAPGGSIIGTLPVGRQVKGVLVGNMVRFTYSSQTGYVYASLLQATPVRVTRYVVANSIIRSAPGGSIIARPWRPLLVSGTIQGAWLKFTYNGRTAYVAMSSTTTQNPPITGYTKSTVNVRSSPGGSVIGSLPANRKVSGVLVGNWVKFTYAGRTGYISASLLKK